MVKIKVMTCASKSNNLNSRMQAANIKPQYTNYNTQYYTIHKLTLRSSTSFFS